MGNLDWIGIRQELDQWIEDNNITIYRSIEIVLDKIQQLVDEQIKALDELHDEGNAKAHSQPYDTELEAAAKKAANSGSRIDLQEYLKLRKERGL